MDFFRGRRLRMSPQVRRLVAETELRPQDLIQPWFVFETDDADYKKAIGSMPGQYQLSIPQLLRQAEGAVKNGLAACILFGIPKEKDPKGSQAYAENGIVQDAVRALKREFPELCVITDVCLCEYTSHGHCGLVDGERIENDPTLALLAQTALSHARAGADMVAPSDMMDGRVAAIRTALDAEGFTDLPLMSYAVKYASAFYGPFREAAEGTPKFGDRKTHQMDPANRREALREAEADLAEGADILMVKPAGPYLDVIRDLREAFDAPLAAYQVSGEYALIKAAAERGWVDGRAVALESLTGIKRAGASLILTYFAEELLPAIG
ncbi:delta-aminolevulinic acid dehydratase [Alkalidesulfovibrio alkalitolerans DSM 16529]|uniref:Delta-aminolevulinic acid dehydratase n=1 Tax=Alkalidesulfovibrio alkalitolerans DSM 16529 TaxID=1121439 RepID=S7T3I8_9BACT|nr:porphobilinogen synthase [Alkalidesulfovibrio alkalitolerans]EPR31075.1 delta-aminolevulinic acid dehydratase [Alkalidesulfovibrio alkalitolerans DSM 16529]